MPKLFISHRIGDNVPVATAIGNRLARHFGSENVFRDSESVRRSDVVLALIGPRWLDDPGDRVRAELRTAFEHRIPVVPVLLDSTSQPRPEDLPPVLAPRHVRHHSFESDVCELIEGLPGTAPSPAPQPGRNVQHITADRSTVFVNQGHQVNSISSPSDDRRSR
ncbi:toll/interleukin-1 receptor domain-containing protein [Amycolatopsis sp. NPDC051045]|uniref:toll/interleukin-1 receptor domain-containing protein n=1 Tax=Amycolatopsis sp. NPDC051045 TaxID=3156922 RepID=UPI003427DB87